MTPRSWQRCEDCGNELDERSREVRCPECGGLFTIEHQDPRLRGAALQREFDQRDASSGVWRFGDVVLPTAVEDAVSYPEGNTPLLSRGALSRWCDVERLWLKHEGMNPTGSFKDRGMTVAMTQARRIGARAVACASTGNTSASLAAYGAMAGIPALAIVPDRHVALGKLAQTMAYGAHTLLIDGDFDACLRLMQDASRELGIYLVNSVNPFRLEGQKTIVLDLLRQLHWQVPDWLVLPAGNLGNTSAFGKALDEAMRWGLIDRMPRIAAIQAAGAAPFATAYDRGFGSIEAVNAETVATAIRIGAPASYQRAVRAIRGTNGVVLAVSDDEILRAKLAIDAAGVGCEPASAATLAGIRQLRQRGTIDADQSVVAVLTGHLLKDPAIVTELHGEQSPVPELANGPVRIPATVKAIDDLLFSIWDSRHNVA